MRKNRYRYKACLSGTNSTESHINNLKSNPSFELKISQSDELFNVTVYGPKKDHLRSSRKDIKSQLSERAKNLGFDVPEIVNVATEDIHYSEMAERLILISLLELQMPVCKKNAKAEVTLMVEEEGGPKVKECLDYYSCWRISCLAQALEMVIDGSVEKYEI